MVSALEAVVCIYGSRDVIIGSACATPCFHLINVESDPESHPGEVVWHAVCHKIITAHIRDFYPSFRHSRRR